jgi:hypothetical protein
MNYKSQKKESIFYSTFGSAVFYFLYFHWTEELAEGEAGINGKFRRPLMFSARGKKQFLGPKSFE